MKGFSRAALTMVAALGLVACGSDSDTIEYSNLQAVHASSDAPLANVWINDKSSLTGVDYGMGSGYMKLREGMNSIQVDVQLPGDETATVIPKTELDLDSDLNYNVFVVGDADGSPNPVESLVVTRSADSMADANSLDVQVVHAASGVPAVDLYVTEPGADLASATPLMNLAYKASTDVLNIPAGEYQVRLAVGDSVAFDSGTISLAANSNLTIAAIGTGDSNSTSPVKLLVLDGSGSSIIEDMGSQAEVRVGHLVDGAPIVDVNVNGAAFGPLADLAFKEIRGYLDLDAGAYDIDVYVDGTTTNPIIDVDGLMVAGGMDYSVYAVGVVSPAIDIEPLVVEDMRRAVATSATLNVTHAAANPVAEMVDIYLTTSAGIDGSDPTIANFAYKDSVQGLYVAEGTYYVTVTVAGDPSTVAVDSAPVNVMNGVVYQVVAIDDGNNGGFNLLVDDVTD
ncbi:2-dehydropantoate 2-reductase [Vibrio parahaemolyticus]|nr:2-dehydropantoate 2-reductase [Vibrio parahaemolyticus]